MVSIYELKLAQEKLEALQFLLEQVDELQQAISGIDLSQTRQIKAEISQAKNIILTAKDDVLKIKQDLSDVGDLAELAKDLKQKEQLVDELILKINLNSVIDDKTASSVAAYSSNKVNELLENMKQSLQNLIPKNTITTDDDGKIDISLLPNLNKSDVGLSNVDDTADINKPISTAMQEALDTKLGKDEIASDSSKLGGIEASEYLKKSEISPELKTDTYKGVRIFSRLSSVPYQWYYQEVIRDSQTNEILKYGDIFCKGAVAFSNQNVYALARDKYADFMRVPLPYNDECVELISSTGQYNNAFVIARFKDRPYIYVWGHNGYGQLGAGNTTAITIPKKIEFNANVKQVWAYMAQTTAVESMTWVLLENDELYCCGNNGYGQLGIGTKVNSSVFVKSSLSGKGVVRVFVSAGLTTFVVTKAKSELENKYDVYGCGHNKFGSLGVSGTNKLEFIEVATDVDSFEADEYSNNPSSSGNSYHDCAWYIKDSKLYSAGIVDNMVKFGVGNAQRNKPYEVVKKTDGSEFEGVVWAHLFNYQLGMILTSDSRLWLNNVNDVSDNLVGLNGEVIKAKGWQLYANNVKEIKILSQRYYSCYNALLVLNDGTCYQISNAPAIATLSAANLSLSNPAITAFSQAFNSTQNTLVKISDARLDMPVAYSDKLEFCSYLISDGGDYELQNIFICDGKKIYTNASAKTANTTLVNAGGFTPLNLANTGGR